MPGVSKWRSRSINRFCEQSAQTISPQFLRGHRVRARGTAGRGGGRRAAPAVVLAIDQRVLLIAQPALQRLLVALRGK
jgi:hypothetical protein